MVTMITKFCRDCRYCSDEGTKFAKCMKEPVDKVDYDGLVTGHGEGPEYYFCSVRRKHAEACGIDAKWFEPREANAPQS